MVCACPCDLQCLCPSCHSPWWGQQSCAVAAGFLARRCPRCPAGDGLHEAPFLVPSPPPCFISLLPPPRFHLPDEALALKQRFASGEAQGKTRREGFTRWEEVSGQHPDVDKACGCLPGFCPGLAPSRARLRHQVLLCGAIWRADRWGLQGRPSAPQASASVMVWLAPPASSRPAQAHRAALLGSVPSIPRAGQFSPNPVVLRDHLQGVCNFLPFRDKRGQGSEGEI